MDIELNNLDDLQNDRYISKIELEKQLKIELKQKDDYEKKNEKEINKNIRNNKRIAEQEKINEKNKEKIDEEEEPQFIGKNRRELYNNILKYKELFPDELKTFKIKKNSSVDELKNYISEIQCIIETTSIDCFLVDSIYTAMSFIEPITSKTKNFNLTGLTNLLKSNKQFNNLFKQMMLKYGCYNNVSVEYQTLLIIISSVYITVQKNHNRQNIENYLNEKI